MIYNHTKRRTERNRLAREAAQRGQQQPATPAKPVRIIKRDQPEQTAAPVAVALPSENVAPARLASDEQPDMFNAVRAAFNRTLQGVIARGRAQRV